MPKNLLTGFFICIINSAKVILLLCVFLSFEDVVTFPTVKERTMSNALFGIYPDNDIDMEWNPAFVFNRNNYYLDFLRLSEYYNDFKGYRVIAPILNGNKFRIDGTILMSEEFPSSDEMHQHNRGELFFGYNTGSIKYGTSIFFDHKDWWYNYPETKQGWNGVTGAKLGLVTAHNSSFSIMISREDTASNIDLLSHLRLVSKNYGLSALVSILPDRELNFIGVYHKADLDKVEFIQEVRMDKDSLETKYSIPLILDFNVLKELRLYGGYTLQIQSLGKEIQGDKSISMGFTYAPSPFAVTVNMGTELFNTYYWEVSFTYGN